MHSRASSAPTTRSFEMPYEGNGRTRRSRDIPGEDRTDALDLCCTGILPSKAMRCCTIWRSGFFSLTGRR